MKKASSEQVGVKYSFWSNIFRRPGIASYYLQDWLEESLTKESDELDRNEAIFWMGLVEQDHHLLYDHIYLKDQKFLFPNEQLKFLIKVFVLSSTNRKAGDLGFSAVKLNNLTDELLSYFILSKVEFNAQRYGSARRLAFKGLELKRSSNYFESERNNFLLGLLYALLVEIEVLRGDLFSADEWMRKLKNILGDHEIEALRKKLIYTQLIIFKAKGRTSEALKLWSIKDAKDWGSITDELIICLMMNMMVSKADKNFKKFCEELTSSFEFYYVNRYIDILVDSKINGPRTLEVLTMILPFEKEEFVEQLGLSDGQRLQLESYRREGLSSRTSLSDLVVDLEIARERVVDSKVYPSELFAKSNTSWLLLLESIQLDLIRTNGALSKNYFHHASWFFRLIKLAHQDNAISSKEFIEALETFTAWGKKIKLNYSKKDWRDDQMLPPAYILIVWMVLISVIELNIQEVNTFYTLSTKKNSLDVEIDFMLDGTNPNEFSYHESRILVAKDQLMYEMDNYLSNVNNISAHLDLLRFNKAPILKWQLSLMS